MIEKVVRKYKLGEEPSIRSYWMSKTPIERFQALYELVYSNNKEDETDAPPRLQRVFRIIRKE